MAAEIRINEAEVPENLKTRATYLRDGIVSLPVALVQREAPELLAGFEILSREAARDTQQYRRAVSSVGIDRVIVVD